MSQLGLRVCMLSMLIACGCGKTDPLHRQAVSGKITLNGDPLKAGSIEFSPVENGSPSGASIQDGSYVIPKEKGLPPGDYLVRISASDGNEQTVEVPGESNKISKELIPAKYNVKTTLRFHVDEKGQTSSIWMWRRRSDEPPRTSISPWERVNFDNQFPLPPLESS